MIVRLVFAGVIAGVFLITTAIGSPTGSGIFSTVRGETGGQEVREARAEKGRGAESDPNIKSDSDANDPRSRPEAPESKGGSRAGEGPVGALPGCYRQLDRLVRSRLCGWYLPRNNCSLGRSILYNGSRANTGLRAGHFY